MIPTSSRPGIRQSNGPWFSLTPYDVDALCLQDSSCRAAALAESSSIHIFDTHGFSPTPSSTFDPLHPPQQPPHEVRMGDEIAKLFKANARNTTNNGGLEVFLFIKLESPSPARCKTELLNLTNVRFATLCFTTLELKEKQESFQIHLHNRVGIQFGIAQREKWKAHPNQEEDEKQGFGVGDNDFSWGFDPVHGVAWHNRQPFTYGIPCNSEDGIRCIVRLGEKTGTISFERYTINAAGESIKSDDFGVAFTVDVEKLRDVVPAVSLARFQCIRFDEGQDCTQKLGTIIDHSDEKVTVLDKHVELVHVLANNMNNEIDYSKVDDALHLACVLEHGIFIDKIVHQIQETRVADFLNPIKIIDCGFTPVHMCVITRQFEHFKHFITILQHNKLLHKLADVGQDQYNLVHIAAIYGEFQSAYMLTSLKEFRKCLNAPKESTIQHKTENGIESGVDFSTPLDEAVRNGHLLVAELLIRCGGTLRSRRARELYQNRLDSVLLLLKFREEYQDVLKTLNPTDEFVKHLLAKDLKSFRTKYTMPLYLGNIGERRGRSLVNIKFKSMNEVLYAIAAENKLASVSQIQSIHSPNICIYPSDDAINTLIDIFAKSDSPPMEVTIRQFTKDITDIIYNKERMDFEPLVK